VLGALYEQDFVRFSYGFSTSKNPHQALDALSVGITQRKVNWVLDADIRGFFDTLDHGWLVNYRAPRGGSARRTADPEVAQVGVLEEGTSTSTLRWGRTRRKHQSLLPTSICTMCLICGKAMAKT